MKTVLRTITALSLLMLVWAATVDAETPRVLAEGERPKDARLDELRTLDDYFPFQQVENESAWQLRAKELRQRVLVATGLWPMPTKTPLNAVAHSLVERDDYTVHRVYFESFPGHFVTGNLYRPRQHIAATATKKPAVLCPHGHWSNGRFHGWSHDEVRRKIAEGAERFVDCGRFPLQSRCVQLARMGCIVFHYDMVGYADSAQLAHRPGVRNHMTGKGNWGFFSPHAELQQINMMGLQTYNSVRALDLISSLDDVDQDRIAITGGSGGGTQTFMLTAIDDRVDVSVPCVMVSTAMQGGCTCENANYLRIDAGNIDLAALALPRPLGMVAADDWTVELQTKGFPDLQKLYDMHGHTDRVSATFNLHFGHNYNAVSRSYVYGIINNHFDLGFETPIIEREFVPLSREEMTVWTGSHPRPTGDQAGDAHERALTHWWANDARKQLRVAKQEGEAKYKAILRGGWETILAKTLGDFDDATITNHEKPRENDRFRLSTALIESPSSGQQLPALFLLPPEGWNEQLVIWLTDLGKAGLLDESGDPIEAIAPLLEEGFAVAGVDLIGQGEFLTDGDHVENARLHTRGDQPWQHAAAYTFGYNHPLLVQRVHDVLATIKAAQKYERPPSKTHLVGLGQHAGTVALAANVVADGSLTTTTIRTDGFRFDELNRLNHPNFVPGATRYDGVGGLMELAKDSAGHLRVLMSGAADGDDSGIAEGIWSRAKD